jgi:hypothetical protein
MTLLLYEYLQMQICHMSEHRCKHMNVHVLGMLANNSDVLKLLLINYFGSVINFSFELLILY